MMTKRDGDSESSHSHAWESTEVRCLTKSSAAGIVAHNWTEPSWACPTESTLRITFDIIKRTQPPHSVVTDVNGIGQNL